MIRAVRLCLTAATELLRSYRIAHARVGLIEAFEASLRENTPLTSISEPAAFVEYLGQLNVKSDMLMEELKRVSKERDDMNKKLEEAEVKAKEVSEEMEKLQAQLTASETSKDESADQADSGAPSSTSKSTKDTEATEDDEEFFSYDSELPRVQSQLKESEEKAEKLGEENESLKKELSVAQESAESFMKNLETTTNDLLTFKDQYTRAQKENMERQQQLDSTIVDLQSKLQSAEEDLTKHKNDYGVQGEALTELTEKLNATSKELEEMHATQGERLVESHGQETLKAEVEQLESELAKLRETHTKAEKRSETLNGLVNNLRDQLKDAESKRDSALKDLELVKKELETASNEKIVKPTEASTPVPTPTIESAPSSKKKNKKKKKGGKGGDGANVEKTPSEAGDANGLLSPSAAEFSPSQMEDAQKTVAQLQSDLEAKVAAIERLENEVVEKGNSIETLKQRLKDEEAMAEEIETLRLDLLHFGAEHTEAKDKVKQLQTEKTALKENLASLEKEIAELRTGKSAQENSEQEQKALAAEFEELKVKADSLQTDLSVAEQLAASRFKELTDMREILQKAQPELGSLRKEVAELRSTREELSTKSAELRRLEGREKDLRSEISTYRSSTLR